MRSPYLPEWLRNLVLLVVIALLFALMPQAAFGQALDKPTFVVALDKLDNDGLYGRTVMIAAPLPNGGHYGFILNKPTQHTMGEIFRDHEASKAIVDPIYLGGPERAGVIFAIAKTEASPGSGSRELAPGVWLILQADVMDAFIEATPNAARYYMGYVRWSPGELAEEVRRGMMMLRAFDVGKLFLPDTSKMYDELVTPTRKPPLES